MSPPSTMVQGLVVGRGGGATVRLRQQRVTTVAQSLCDGRFGRQWPLFLSLYPLPSVALVMLYSTGPVLQLRLLAYCQRAFDGCVQCLQLYGGGADCDCVMRYLSSLGPQLVGDKL